MHLEDFIYWEKINNITGLCDEFKEIYLLNFYDKKYSDIKQCYESSFRKCISCVSGWDKKWLYNQKSGCINKWFAI